MKLFLLAIAVYILICFGALAQQSPVHWRYQVEKVTPSRANVFFNAIIEPGWKLYAKVQGDDGPYPTTFELEPSDEYRPIGGVAEISKPVSYYDKNLLMNVSWFMEEAVYRLPVILAGDKAVVRGDVSYMVCNDRICLPPDHWPFAIVITADKP